MAEKMQFLVELQTNEFKIAFKRCGVRMLTFADREVIVFRVMIRIDDVPIKVDMVMMPDPTQ